LILDGVFIHSFLNTLKKNMPPCKIQMKIEEKISFISEAGVK
jgi:hypothetical protein